MSGLRGGIAAVPLPKRLPLRSDIIGLHALQSQLFHLSQKVQVNVLAADKSSEVLEIDLSGPRASAQAAPPSRKASPVTRAAPAALPRPTPIAAAVPASAMSGASAPAAPAVPQPSSRLVGRLLRDIVETAVLTLAIFLLARSTVQTYRIAGTSMAPNFAEFQYLLVNRLAYLLDEPQRGDVIVFSHPDGTDRDLIKRVIGIPGDTIEIRAGQVYINGLPTVEPYALLPFDYDVEPTLVSTDALYVLGDNRADSADSHTWGVLSQSESALVGKAWFSLWPLDAFGRVKHLPIAIQLPVSS